MDDLDHETPGTVVGAVAAGVAPLPFLAVYATLFIARGGFRPVNPPDITTTAHGELGAGLIAALIFILGSLSVYWFVGGKRRWLFALGQAATLATAIDFVSDSTSGPASIPVLLIVTSVAALVLAFMPTSWAFMRSARGPERRRRRDYREPAQPSVDIR
ncbi:hypothetical protein [Jatrophihabitans sp.]|uniref:hypothetical protein n=1 Tax=Jatrophihabitans sp. TaxID=1932789 RepID=UPI0030C67AD9